MINIRAEVIYILTCEVIQQSLPYSVRDLFVKGVTENYCSITQIRQDLFPNLYFNGVLDSPSNEHGKIYSRPKLFLLDTINKMSRCLAISSCSDTIVFCFYTDCTIPHYLPYDLYPCRPFRRFTPKVARVSASTKL